MVAPKQKKIAVTPTDYNGMLNIYNYLKNDEMFDIPDLFECIQTKY